MGSDIRTFIAVPIDDALRARAADLQRELSSAGSPVRWVEPENLHVTLVFLGETDPGMVPEIGRCMEAVAAGAGPFELSFRGAGAFPNPHRPKVVWVGIEDPTGSLARLHRGLSDRLEGLGVYVPEDRAYSPHLTLGRTKSPANQRQLAAAIAAQAGWHADPVAVTHMHLLESELTPKGAVYSPLTTVPLSGE